jgi:hypothetical protein
MDGNLQQKRYNIKEDVPLFPLDGEKELWGDNDLLEKY